MEPAEGSRYEGSALLESLDRDGPSAEVPCRGRAGVGGWTSCPWRGSHFLALTPHSNFVDSWPSVTPSNRKGKQEHKISPCGCVTALDTPSETGPSASQTWLCSASMGRPRKGCHNRGRNRSARPEKRQCSALRECESGRETPQICSMLGCCPNSGRRTSLWSPGGRAAVPEGSLSPPSRGLPHGFTVAKRVKSGGQQSQEGRVVKL